MHLKGEHLDKRVLMASGIIKYDRLTSKYKSQGESKRSEPLKKKCAKYP